MKKYFYATSARSDAFSRAVATPQRAALHPLVGALALALFVNPLYAVEATPSNPHAPQNWPVQTCNDVIGVGSLRYIANHAQSGDTIDFSQLPMLCNMRDSKITLTGGEIVLHQPSISLIGPLPADGTVTLSAGGNSRVLKHQAYTPFSGTLTIQDLRITDGYVHDAGDIDGGCVTSDSNVSLFRSSVLGCKAKSDTGSALGGGIQASGSATLTLSKITGNSVEVGTNGNAEGGGVAAHAVQMKYSQINNNRATGSYGAEGGGISAGTLLASYCTVANNSSDSWGGGIAVRSGNLDSTIRNSTFAGNHSSYSGGGLFMRVRNLYVYNSTIANNAIDAGHSGGLYISATAARIESTIIANNASPSMAAEADLYFKNGTLTGTSNAIVSSNAHPAGFIAVEDDPKLAPLAWNGGPTQTIGPFADSPVIGLGNNSAGLTSEQRGTGFPRATGAPAKVDIGAVQYDTTVDDRIFVSDLDQFF